MQKQLKFLKKQRFTPCHLQFVYY